MRYMTFAAAVLMLTVVADPAPAQDVATAAVLSGTASVRDGDDVLFGQVSVRLQGIAAPEDRRGSREAGGPEATASLRALVDGRFLVCHLDGATTGKSGRPTGICYLGDLDVGRFQVETGHALDCPAFSHGRYAPAEAAAKVAGRDLGAIYPLPPYCR